MLLHLSWALHPLPVIRIWILSLHGPPVRPRVSIAVLVIHFLLLVAILHVIHIPFMAFSRRPIHAIHVSFIVLKKNFGMKMRHFYSTHNINILAESSFKNLKVLSSRRDHADSRVRHAVLWLGLIQCFLFKPLFCCTYNLILEGNLSLG